MLQPQIYSKVCLVTPDDAALAAAPPSSGPLARHGPFCDLGKYGDHVLESVEQGEGEHGRRRPRLVLRHPPAAE